MQRSTTRMFHRRWHSWKQTPYCWYNLWKCTLTRSISSPFPPLTLKPCFLQMALNSTLVHSCNLPLSIAFNTASSTSYRNTNCAAGLEEVEGTAEGLDRGAKSEVAHKWANWLPHPCRIGDPHRLRAGGKIRSGPQVGKLATSPLPYRGAPPPQSGGQNQKWPTSGQIGYLTPAVSGIPTASERGAKSEVAHKWANWLPHPCRIGEPHRLRAGGKIRSGAQKRAAGGVDMARVRPGGKGL